MTIKATKCIIIAILSLAMRPGILIQGQQSVPCHFIFGDSLSDNGNNNNLNTPLKANYLPYGIDYTYGAYGRFTNDVNIPDLIGRRIGFIKTIAAYAVAGATSTILRGLNYASAGAGILDETSYQFGDRVWMNKQLSNHQATVNRIDTIVGNQTAANNLLNQCLYTITIGNNDYLTNYFSTFPVTLARLLVTPEMFANKLIAKFSQQLTTLYNLQARKVAVFGVAPIGSSPNSLAQFSADQVASINNAVQLFNNKLISLVTDLNANLSGARFTYINTYAIFSANLSSIGVRVLNVPCCETNALSNGLCVRNGGVCSNRNEYAYFDNINPTTALANYTAARAFNSQSQSDAIPVDIATLLQL